MKKRKIPRYRTRKGGKGGKSEWSVSWNVVRRIWRKEKSKCSVPFGLPMAERGELIIDFSETMSFLRLHIYR